MKDEKRRARLVELLSRLESGVDVATRDMKNVLTEVEFIRYEDLWRSEKSERMIQKPPKIKKYELMIKQAHAADARSEKIRRGKGFKDDLQRKRLAYESDHIAGRAYEYYVELVQSGFADYFVDASRIIPENEPAMVVSELPVLKGSKSAYNNPDDCKKKKRDYKVIILQEALDRMDGVLVELSDEQELMEFKEQLKRGRGKDKGKLDGFKV